MEQNFVTLESVYQLKKTPFLYLPGISITISTQGHLSWFFCQALGLVMVKIVGSGNLTLLFFFRTLSSSSFRNFTKFLQHSWRCYNRIVWDDSTSWTCKYSSNKFHMLWFQSISQDPEYQCIHPERTFLNIISLSPKRIIYVH